MRLLTDLKLWARMRRGFDLLAVVLGVLLAVTAGPAAQLPDLLAAAAFAVVTPILAYSRRSFSKQFGVGILDSCGRAVASCAIGAMAAIAVGAVAGSASPDLIGLRLWLIVAALLCAVRTLLGTAENRARARGLLMTPTLVVGAGAVGGWVVRRLAQQPSLGLDPIGFLDLDPDAASTDPDVDLPILGTPDEAITVARMTGARQLVFAFSWERDHQLAGIVRRCQAAGLAVAIVPRMYEAINERASLDHVGGLPLMSFRALNSQGWRFAVKHSIDRLCALVALVALAPLMLVIAIAVKLSSPGPVIYRQRRVGRGGREFDLFKFRSMRTHARRPAFRPAAGSAPGGIEGTDRRTRVGRWLRNTSLDELPQLFNVLRGEMSAIGPRPERPEFAARFAFEVPGYDERHRVKPGITGWAQVNGLRGQTSIADRVEWDNHYIENWSIWLELRTLALTMAAVMLFKEEHHAPSGPPMAGRAHRRVQRRRRCRLSRRRRCARSRRPIKRSPAGAPALDDPGPRARDEFEVRRRADLGSPLGARGGRLADPDARRDGRAGEHRDPLVLRVLRDGRAGGDAAADLARLRAPRRRPTRSRRRRTSPPDCKRRIPCGRCPARRSRPPRGAPSTSSTWWRPTSPTFRSPSSWTDADVEIDDLQSFATVPSLAPRSTTRAAGSIVRGARATPTASESALASATADRHGLR